ncbi:MAG TPA: hypothetical protein DEQ47_04190 [Solibacterales bacterium]|nr:hypothetical protein [Bryobacterales bacterium]
MIVAMAQPGVPAGHGGSHVHYVGGTLAELSGRVPGQLEISAGDTLRFETHGTQVSVPYSSVNLIEYGLRVNRRYVAAVLISPLLLLSKKRSHFVTVGYADADGRQQAMVFQVDKGDVRAVLVSLEARTGRKVEYQDEEARKAGKG